MHSLYTLVKTMRLRKLTIFSSHRLATIAELVQSLILGD